MPQLIPIAIGGISAIMGARSAGRAQSQQNAQAQALSQMVREYVNGTLTKASPVWDRGVEALDYFASSGALSPELRDTINQARSFAQNLPQAPGQVIPYNPQAINAPNPDRLGAPARAASDQNYRIIANEGLTGDLGYLQDRYKQIFGDAYNSPGIGALEDRANELLSNGGRTGENSFLFDAARDIIGQGGYSPELLQDRSLGRGLVQSGGMTPQIAQLQSQLQSIIQREGLTPEGRRILNTLIPLIESGGQGGALLPFNTAVSLARNNTISDVIGQQEAVRRQALQRGAAPGTIVGSGLQNQGLSEASDEALRAISRAQTEAALGQQGLQLNQLLGATQGAGDILRTGAGLVSTATGGLADLARSAAANIGTGAGLINSANSTAAQRLGIGGNMASTSLADMFNRLQLGVNTLSGAQGLRQNLLNMGANFGLGVENQIANNQFNAGNQLLDLTGINVGRENNIYQWLLGQRGQDIDVRGQDIDAQLRAMLGSIEAYNAAANRQLSGWQSLLENARGMYGNAANAIGAGTNIQFPTNPLAAPALTGGLNMINYGAQNVDWGNLFGGGGGGWSGTAGLEPNLWG